MALIGNYSVLNKTSGSFIGGPSVSDTRANYRLTGKNYNRYLDGFSPKSATPSGYVPPYSWVPAIKAGGLATFVTVRGTGDFLRSNLAGGLNGVAPLSGTGNITNASILYAIVAAAALSGSGNATAAITGKLEAVAALTGAGDLAGVISVILEMAAALAGSGETGADIAGALSATSDLLGAGDLSGAMSGALAIAASLTGSATLNSEIMALWSMVAGLQGDGNTTANLQAIGNTVAALIGTGQAAGAMRADATIGADINVTGELLTTANVAASVWDALASTYNGAGTLGELVNASGAGGNPWIAPIDGTYTASDILKIIAAALAGKASGGGTPTITIRNLSDTQDVITLTVDASGNRSAVTLDP